MALSPFSDEVAALFASRGFCCLDHLLDAAELEALRSQADRLVGRLADEGRDLCDEQCVAEVLEDLEEGAARSDGYFALRERRCPSDDPALLEALLTRVLPVVAASALGCESPRLFNEHFVVKPARRAGAFAWHTDGALQLEAQLALGDAAATALEYVSLWVALDDVSEESGPLVLLPRDAPQPPEAPWHAPTSPATTRWLETEGLRHAARLAGVRAGGGVLFSSRMWHCSAPNGSPRARRVFYAQYSREAIGGEAAPLALAVRTAPCWPAGRPPPRVASAAAAAAAPPEWSTPPQEEEEEEEEAETAAAVEPEPPQLQMHGGGSSSGSGSGGGGSGASGSSSTWRLRAAGLSLWPAERPEAPPLLHGWVHAGNERLLRRLLRDRQPRVAIELGCWLGLCSTLLLEAAPALSLWCVDLWDAEALLREQRDQYEHDAQAMRILSTVDLHATFLRNAWQFRRRCFPLRQRTLDALRTIHATGAAVDLIYVDASHEEAAVLAELRLAWRLFPAATLCGDDWQWLGVRAAVRAFAAEVGGGATVASHPKENWWLLESLPPPPPPPPPAEERGDVLGEGVDDEESSSAGAAGGGAPPKRARLDFVPASDETKYSCELR